MVDLHDYFRGYLDNVEPVLDVFFLTLHAIGLFTDILMPCMARSIFRCFSNSILNRSSILVLFCVLFEVHLQWGWGTVQRNHQCVGPSRARHGCASSFFEEDSQTGHSHPANNKENRGHFGPWHILIHTFWKYTYVQTLLRDFTEGSPWHESQDD